MKVNGKDVPLDRSVSLASYLLNAGFDIDKVAVERNGMIETRENYGHTLLNDDDVLEIVWFVGGG